MTGLGVALVLPALVVVAVAVLVLVFLAPWIQLRRFERQRRRRGGMLR